jgi:ureidoglycolate amidohydrolase
LRLKDPLNADDPSACSPEIAEVIDQVRRGYGLTAKYMISSAYRVSLFLARITSIAMMLIPRRGGVSQRPDDYAVPGDIAINACMLAATPGEQASE